MNGQTFILLLNPVVMLLLAAVFVLLWRWRPRRHYVLCVALAFVTAGLGFVVQDLLPPLPEGVVRPISNGLLLIAILSLCTAALLRARIAVPVRGFAAISCVGALAFGWYLYADPSVASRIHVVNFTFGALVGVTLLRLWTQRGRSRVDWLLIGASALAAANIVFRLAVFLWVGPEAIAPDGLQQSFYWTTVHFSTAVTSVSIALAFLLAIATELVEELRARAEVDHLSGLLNRGGLEAAAARLFATCDARGWPVTIVLADLDDFKVINDTYGHGAGDAVIAAVGEIVSATGEAAAAGRIGGEEFALLYPNRRRAEIEALAEAMRATLEARPVPGLPAHHRATMSIGIYTRLRGDSFSDMLVGADRALYQAKRAGKNRVEILRHALRPVTP